MKTRLVIPTSLFRQLLTGAHQASDRTASCAVGVHQREHETRLLAHFGNTSQAQRLILFTASAAPTSAQLEVLLDDARVAAVIAITNDNTVWGAIRAGTAISALSQLELIGPLIYRQAVLFPGEILPVEQDRYRLPSEYPERHSRTIEAIQWNTWITLVQCSVALIGAGRMGSIIIETLARCGLPVNVFDTDVIEEHNLGEMLGVGVVDLGQLKAETLATRLQTLIGATWHQQTIRPFPQTIVDAYRQVLEADIIVSCVDNDEARLAAAILANAFHLPLLDLGTAIFRQPEAAAVRGADVRLLLPGEGCLVCFGGLVDYEGALRRLARRNTTPRAEWWIQRTGSLLSLNLLAAARGMDLLTDWAAGKMTSSTWLQIRYSEAGELREQRVTYQHENRSTNCPLCLRAGLGDAGIYW